MKKFTNLNRDVRPAQQPEGSYQFAKNGILNYVKGSVVNEPGFTLSSAQIPYTPIGVVETDLYPVIISTNNVNTAIGYYDEDTDTYKPILNDNALSFKLNFSTDKFVTGEAQRNYKGQIVIAITDKTRPMMYINCDEPDLTSLNALLFFPGALAPQMEIVVQAGGTLLPGAYYVAVNYLSRDGAETAYVNVSAPQIVTGTLNSATDKALEIQLTNIDTRYNQVGIAIVSKINGVFKAVKFVNPVQVQTAATIIYGGSELTEDITLEEVLTPGAYYERVGAIGQLNDKLYLADLAGQARLKMQKYANLVELKWASKELTTSPENPDHVTGKERTFMHREVYDYYIRYKTTTGKSEAFIIPGPQPLSAHLLDSSTATTEGFSAKVFHVSDTIQSFSALNKTGTFGVWQNATELYPDTEDFDSSGIGGRNLRNQPVLHHRFPSINWCKENLYTSDPDYGRTKLDMLGISISNVIIPAEYADIIIGWEILYAKRSIANSTVIGQSLLMFGGRKQQEPAGSPTTYLSSGGNFESEVNFKSTPKQPVILDQSIFHFHSFDMLLNRPSVTPQFLSLELKHRKQNIPGTGGYLEDGGYAGGKNNGPHVYLIDYKKANPPVLPAKKFKGIRETEYVPNDSQSAKWENLAIEGFFGGRVNNYEALIPGGEISRQKVNPGSVAGYTPSSQAVQQESTFLSNLMAVRSNLYTPFSGQTLVRAAESNSIINNTVFYRGDSYIVDYTFHTYGRYVADGNGVDGGDVYFKGTKVARRFVCETVSNVYTRFETPGNIYSKFYPKSALTSAEDANYLTPFLRNNDPNQFGYSRDTNALDDLISSDIYDTYAEEESEFPYRIHRTGMSSRQSKVKNWKTVLPLDFYEGQKNMGRLINVTGQDDRLLIHYENSLMITQDKAKLESDIIAITLGTGDIFQFDPQEGLSEKLGYAGTQQQLACIKTPFGYIYPDTKEGGMFIFKEGLQNITRQLNDFFHNYLNIPYKNVFTGNGITLGYDQKYTRLLLSVKHQNHPDEVRLTASDGTTDYKDEWLPELEIGDIVYREGRFMRFLGINETAFSCEGALVPVVNDKSITIPENTAIGSVIGTMTGTNVSNFVALESSPFSINASTGVITVIGELDFFNTPDSPNRYIIDIKGISSDGSQDIGTLTVILTEVAQPIVPAGGEVTIQDDIANSTNIFTVTVEDREGPRPMTFDIIGGDPDGIFGINSSGVISVVDNFDLDGFVVNRYTLTVRVYVTALGVGTAVTCTVYVNVVPTGINGVGNRDLTLFDDVVAGTIVSNMDELVEDPAITVQMFGSNPNFSYNETTKNITASVNMYLGTAIEAEYVIPFQASDGTQTVTFYVTITVWHNYGSIEFALGSPSCDGADEEYADITITKITGPSTGLITTLVNLEPADFQGQPVPYYEPLIGAVGCGGAAIRYLSVQQSVVVAKNDCSLGFGTAFTFYVSEGLFYSDTSQSAANALAAAYMTSAAQAFANLYGKCS